LHPSFDARSRQAGRCIVFIFFNFVTLYDR
jgi:hypothetical protein